MVHWVIASSQKVSPRKSYFQSIRYRASGCGALGYCKFSKGFSKKILYFQAIHGKSFPGKKLCYMAFSKSFLSSHSPLSPIYIPIPPYIYTRLVSSSYSFLSLCLPFPSSSLSLGLLLFSGTNFSGF